MVWLRKKTTDEQSELLREARKSTANLRDKFEQRKEEIEQRRAEIRRKIEEKEAFNLRKVQVKEKHTTDIVTFGLWQSRDEVDNQVSSYGSTAEKRLALKYQLRCRKTVLTQKAPTKDCYAFTKVVDGKCVALTVDELASNTKLLLVSAAQTTIANMSILVHRRVRHSFINPEDDSEEWYTGKILSQDGEKDLERFKNLR